MKGISFGQYYPANSIIHKMDPRFKILVAITFIVATFLCKSAVSFVALFGIGLALIFISKIPLKTILRSIAPLLFIIAFTVVINIFFGTGEQLLLEVWKIRIYAEGIWRAVFMFLRIFVFLLKIISISLMPFFIQYCFFKISCCLIYVKSVIFFKNFECLSLM